MRRKRDAGEGSIHGPSQRRRFLLVKARIVGGFLSPKSGKMGDRIQAYGHGRVCEAVSCGTVLSTYNPGHFCALHAALGTPHVRPWPTGPTASR
jgi:hypothetical protein